VSIRAALRDEIVKRLGLGEVLDAADLVRWAVEHGAPPDEAARMVVEAFDPNARPSEGSGTP
jgi:hypothetical protein